MPILHDLDVDCVRLSRPCTSTYVIIYLGRCQAILGDCNFLARIYIFGQESREVSNVYCKMSVSAFTPHMRYREEGGGRDLQADQGAATMLR